MMPLKKQGLSLLRVSELRTPSGAGRRCPHANERKDCFMFVAVDAIDFKAHMELIHSDELELGPIIE
jgi:hypothetical protein